MHTPTSRITREHDLDCGSNSCKFGGRGKGGMRTNGRCQCVQHLIDRVNSHTALVEALEAIIEYRDRVGPLGFQLEKLDDRIFKARQAIALAKKGG